MRELVSMIRYDGREFSLPAGGCLTLRPQICHSALSASNSRKDSEEQKRFPITEQHPIIMTLTGTVVEVSGVRLRLGEHFSQSITERILSGNYEQDEMRGLSAILAPRDVRDGDRGRGRAFYLRIVQRWWVQKTLMRSRQIQSWRR